MDIAKPKLQELCENTNIYEDSDFKELGVEESLLKTLQATIESELGIKYDGDEFLKSRSLGDVFEKTLGKKEFLPELNEATVSSYATVGVPMWIQQENKFVLQNTPGEKAEAHYNREMNFGREILHITKSSGTDLDTMETLFAFACSEMARREMRMKVSDIFFKSYLEKNPGWNPYVIV